MRKSMLASLLIIVLAAAAITGGTLAWFTDEAVIAPNVFTAGTLKIEANETFNVDGQGDPVENWNPGDCVEKKVEVEITGTKRAYLRMQFDEGWYSFDAETEEWVADSALDVGIVKKKVGQAVFPTDDWTKIGDWYYYAGVNAPAAKISVITKVCLDGSADNAYQGKQYRLGFKFEAIQVTNEAVNDAWGVYWDADAEEWKEAPAAPAS